MKPYYEHRGITIFHADWHDVPIELLKADLLLMDGPYGIKEAAGKNKSRTNLAVAKDYGNHDWDNEPVNDFDLIQLRSMTKWQIIWGGNFYILPPSSCWLVWDKVNGENDFADCELAWTNFDKAVRLYKYMWNGMLKEQPEYRMHPTQKPQSLFRWCLKQAPDEVNNVVDPFMGSGTTLVAAKALGLNAVGVERIEAYCESAAIRLQQESFEWGAFST